MTEKHQPGGRLPLLTAKPAVTFPAAEHHRPLAVSSYAAWWQRHIGVNNLPEVVTQLLPRVGFEPTTCWSQVQRSTRCATAPPTCNKLLIIVGSWPGIRSLFLAWRERWGYCNISTRHRAMFHGRWLAVGRSQLQRYRRFIEVYVLTCSPTHLVRHADVQSGPVQLAGDDVIRLDILEVRWRSHESSRDACLCPDSQDYIPQRWTISIQYIFNTPLCTSITPTLSLSFLP